MELGCRKNGCGDDRKTTRWTLRARRATTAETVAGPAAQTLGAPNRLWRSLRGSRID